MSNPTSIFTSLPGLAIPVGEVSRTLSHIWDSPEGPSEFRATQMNLIVHFGRGTDPAEAQEIFGTALRFSQRYPSRIVILCPEDRPSTEALLTSKLFSECYIGKSGRDRACMEAIILAYPTEGKDFLENQVSVLLETDLPTYYWQHHFQAARRVTDYGFFLKIARRVVFDSRRESLEAAQIEWPKPEAVRDLAFASLLPVRQSVGQFLSGFAPDELVCGLQEVEVCHCGGTAAEAVHLRDWVLRALKGCAAEAGVAELDAKRCSCRETEGERRTIELRFGYEDDRFFRWQGRPDDETAQIDADFGRGRMHLPTSLKLLKPEAALAEALFF